MSSPKIAVATTEVTSKQMNTNASLHRIAKWRAARQQKQSLRKCKVTEFVKSL
jgi:hypothetical protein